jgi:iron complex outermembrane recepter protein
MRKESEMGGFDMKDFSYIIRFNSCAVLAIAVACMTPATAFAQSDTPETEAKADDGGIEDIIVTAQRREENIQDVSIAVQAITGEGLAKSGVTDVSRLDLITPGVTFARYGADSKISMRGANSNNTFLDASPSVGVFVDGVYRPRAAQQTRAFFDVNRVEVLKGPQGTLYGRNTLAGAVNLYSNGPEMGTLGGGLLASYSRFNTFRAEGHVNAPVSDTIAVRVAGMFERGDGWVENLAGENLGSPDTISFRGSIRYEAPGGGDMTLRVTKIRERGNVSGLFAFTGVCRNVTSLGLTDPAGTFQDCRNPRRGSLGSSDFDDLGKLQVLKDFVHEDKIDELNATLELNAPLGENLAVKGIFSYTDFDLDLGQDSDFSEVQVSADFLRERVKSTTAEIQLSSTNDSPFQFTIGGYASRDEIDFVSGAIRFAVDDQLVRPLITVPGFPTTSLRRLDPTPIVSPQINLGDPALPGRPAIIAGRNYGGQSSNNFQYTNTLSLGLFGQASYEIVEGLRLVGGIRYSSDDKESIDYGGARSSTTFVGPQFPLTIPRTIDGFNIDPRLFTSLQDRKYENFTYRAAVEYDVNSDVLLFATYATGFLSGSLATAGTSTDDQKSENIEAGVKSRFLDNKVQFNASVYRTKYTNLVTSFQRPNNSGGVDTVSSNGGDIKATGAEAVIEARPTDGLRLMLALSYLDSKFGTFNVLAPHQLVNGNPTATGRFVNLSGVTPQFAPKFTTSFIAAYDFDLGASGKITPQVQFYYSGRYSSQTQLSFLDSAGTQPSFTKTDLRLGWTSADDRFGIEGFVENLENEIVKQRVTYGGDGIEQAVYGYPRNYGVRARARF